MFLILYTNYKQGYFFEIINGSVRDVKKFIDKKKQHFLILAVYDVNKNMNYIDLFV